MENSLWRGYGPVLRHCWVNEWAVTTTTVIFTWVLNWLFQYLFCVLLWNLTHFGAMASPLPGFETVDLLWGNDGSLMPNLEGQHISLCVAPCSKPVQHAWPYQQLCCQRTLFQKRWITRLILWKIIWRHSDEMFCQWGMAVITAFSILIFVTTSHLAVTWVWPQSQAMLCCNSRIYWDMSKPSKQW